MQAKDLIVMGDARVLGRLYVDEIQAPQDADSSVPRKSKLIPSSESGTKKPTEEGEIYWYYS